MAFGVFLLPVFQVDFGAASFGCVNELCSKKGLEALFFNVPSVSTRVTRWGMWAESLVRLDMLSIFEDFSIVAYPPAGMDLIWKIF